MIVSYFRTLFINTPSIYADIAERITPLALPQPPDYPVFPCIVLSETDHGETPAKTHESTLTVQLWCASVTSEYGYDMLHRIGDKIRNGLINHSGSDSSHYIANVSHKPGGDVEQIADDFSVFILNMDFDVIWEAK